MPYPIFDRDRLRIEPLARREHDMVLSEVLPLGADVPAFDDPAIPILVERIQAARRRNSAVILMMGAHVIKQGLSRFVIDLMQRGLVTAVAMNGAGPIHDWELALVGATTESVARYIREGRFGLWQETGRINDCIRAAAEAGLGLGEAVGREMLDGDFPHKDVSILAAGIRCDVPVTVHVGVGYDIIHEHPNCDGAALGQTSYRDFLVFAHGVESLEGGVLLNFGSAVMGPEVYLKALSMARNVARQEGRQICDIVTAVFDLVGLSGDLSREAPKSEPEYYYRPFKTILVRTVADGGASHYICGDHRVTMPALHHALVAQTEPRR